MYQNWDFSLTSFSSITGHNKVFMTSLTAWFNIKRRDELIKMFQIQGLRRLLSFKHVEMFCFFRSSIRSRGGRRPAAVCTLWWQKLWTLSTPSRPHRSRARYRSHTHTCTRPPPHTWNSSDHWIQTKDLIPGSSFSSSCHHFQDIANTKPSEKTSHFYFTHFTQAFPTRQTNAVVPAGEVQRGGAEGAVVQSVLQPPSDPPDWAGQGGDGAPESGDGRVSAHAAMQFLQNCKYS